MIPIFSPEDIAINKQHFSSKHGICAYTFYVLVTPNGKIVYVSAIDIGSTHDVTHWNTSHAFPPVDASTGLERADGLMLIDELETFYGVGKTESNVSNINQPPGFIFFLIIILN